MTSTGLQAFKPDDVETFKLAFAAFIKGTADADLENEVEKGLSGRFPDLDPSNKPSLKMLSEVLHEAGSVLAGKLPALLAPVTREAATLNKGLPPTEQADLKPLSDSGWLAKTAYTVVEAMQSDWLNQTPLGTFQEVILERPGKAAEWCDSFKLWVADEDELAGRIARQIAEKEFLLPLRAKATTVPKKVSTTDRARAPVEQQAARDFLANIDVAEGDEIVLDATANLLDDMKTFLKSNRKMIQVGSRAELAKAMAREQNTTEQLALATIANNKGRGFTAPDGTVYVANILPGELVGDETLENVTDTGNHDEVHETVHLMSAPGGQTKILAEQGEPCNEGFTEYFAKQMCKKLKVKDAKAYEDNVAFVAMIVGIVGLGPVYTAYMKNGGIQPIIDRLLDLWVAKNQNLIDTKKTAHTVPKKRGVADLDLDLARTKLGDRFKNNFPPTGAQLNFWKAVYL